VVVERRAVLVHERCSSVRRGKEQGKQEDVEETERAENQQETGWKERKCWLCREGRYNLCEDVHFSGVWPHHGTLQRFKVHPAKWLHK
jgi:threonine dehydrogenase-like Zn-dependent dehydrogenase